MSQRDPDNLDQPDLPDKQSQNLPPTAPIQNSRTYSLAGHAHDSFSPRIRNDSFVTAEYESLNPDYNQPDTLPIWGLAKPLPHIVRPGMRFRNDSITSRKHTVNDNTGTSDQTAHPIPHSEMTSNLFDQSEIRPGVISAPNWANKHYASPSQPHTAAKNVNVIPSGSGTMRNLRPEPIREESQITQETDAQLPDSVSKSILHPHPPEEIVNEFHNTSTHVPSFEDFVARTKVHSEHDHTDPTRPQSLVPDDKSIINAARQQIREHVNDTANDPTLQKPAVRIEWEELYPSDDRKRSSLPSRIQYNTVKQPQRRFHNRWAKLRHKLRQPLAEFLGTFVLCLIGLSASLVHATSQDQAGNFFTSDLCWGLGVMMGIYVAGGISGGHINPAISFALSVYRGFPWKQCAIYILAQVLGAFTAAGVVYGLFRDAIIHIGGIHPQSTTGTAFYTQPQEWVSGVTAFFVEFTAAALLSGIILAMGDDNNAPPGPGMQAFIIGLLVSALCMSFGYVTGAALNPARDFGPRLVTLCAGYGANVFTVRNCWWLWGCWIAPIMGALAGAFAYDLFVFTGGESPVNYPGFYWKTRMGVARWKAISGSRGKRKEKQKDEEKAEDNVA